MTWSVNNAFVDVFKKDGTYELYAHVEEKYQNKNQTTFQQKIYVYFQFKQRS